MTIKFDASLQSFRDIYNIGDRGIDTQRQVKLYRYLKPLEERYERALEI